jgi:hypothetical protein
MVIRCEFINQLVQGYCRAVQPSDIRQLLPQWLHFQDDPVFHVPALGCSAASQHDDLDSSPCPLERSAPEVKAEPDDGVRFVHRCCSNGCSNVVPFRSRGFVSACVSDKLSSAAVHAGLPWTCGMIEQFKATRLGNGRFAHSVMAGWPVTCQHDMRTLHVI